MDNNTDHLEIGSQVFKSRLFTGTGKYPDLKTMEQSLSCSRSEMVTVAIRRVQAVESGHKGLIEAIDWSKYWMLPNTAGCENAEEAIRLFKKGASLGDLKCKYQLFLFYSNNGFNDLSENERHIYVKYNPITASRLLKELVRSDPETLTNDVLKKLSPKLCNNSYYTSIYKSN